MAARRQDAWEAQLKEKAFLVDTIKPIVDDTVTFKPPIPYRAASKLIMGRRFFVTGGNVRAFIAPRHLRLM